MRLRLPLFINAYNSPFKPPKLKFYFGKVAIGVPIFFPRVWRKLTLKEAEEKAIESMNNPSLIKKTFEEWVEQYKRYQTAIPKKIGFDFRDLTWKKKWTHDDFRFEYSPVWSFVCFGLQIAVTFVPPEKDHYWEYWLWYHFETDKKLSKKERIEDCMKRNPSTWTRYINGEEEKIDYYKLILKDKYLK